MISPATFDLFRALNETWPPARLIDQSPWTLRQGAGGGQRVSAATMAGPVGEDDIPQAEAGMRALDQHPLFMLRPGEDDLDRLLSARGYDVVDPVAIYLTVINEKLPESSRRITLSWPPPESAFVLWRNSGIGPGRIAVMERAIDRKTALVAIDGENCLGVAFIAISGDIAMLHALEVSPRVRRLGVATDLMQTAKHWARENGACWLSLMVTRANMPANALYRRLGMMEVGLYHYRRAPQAKP